MVYCGLYLNMRECSRFVGSIASRLESTCEYWFLLICRGLVVCSCRSNAYRGVFVASGSIAVRFVSFSLRVCDI